MEGNGRTTRGSPAAVTYHKGGVYSRRSERDGRTYYFIRYTLPNGKVFLTNCRVKKIHS